MSFARPRSRSPRRQVRKSRFSDVNPESHDKDIIKSLETVKTAQTTKVDRKLYVGNLPAGITQSQLVDLLNTALINKKLNAYPGNPVLSSWISQDGHYAFVEFRSIEEANLAFSLNNYPILGQNLKVGRPKTYTGSQPASATERNTLMGGYTLPTISAYANITDVNKQGPLKPVRIYLSSEILCIKNMVSQEDLMDNYEEVLDDIKSNCLKFGQVLEIFVPREGKLAGYVYLEFPTVAEAKTVKKILTGYCFSGKPLEISYIPFKKFKEKELDMENELQIVINA
jgi:RNA recognition motif-containing protein